MTVDLRRAALPVAALLSGASGLLYQEMWARALRLSFGGSVRATGIVLAAFVGGIGAGAVLIGRRLPRWGEPARVYSWMEAAIAAYGAVSLAVLGLLDRAHGALVDPLEPGAGGAVLRLVLSLAGLAIPTVLMGGTLPALAAALQSDDDEGRAAVGRAYGANTLGAMMGAALGAFLLLGTLGMRGTVLAAAVGNVAAAVLARLAPRRKGAAPPTPSAAPSFPVLPAIAAFASGASVIALEVVWLRVLTGPLGGAHRVFGTMLVVVLAGIGTGGLVYARLARRRRPSRGDYALLAAVQALASLALWPLAGPIADFLYLVLPLPIGTLGLGAVGLLTFVAVALPTAIVAGIGYPMLAALARPGRDGVAADVGAIGLGSALGSIVGALGTSLWLLPALGAHGCLRLAASIVGLSALLVAPRVRSGAVAIAVLALAAAAVPGRLPARLVESSITTLSRARTLPTARSLEEFRRRSRRIREHHEEGVDATAVVLRTDQQRTLYVNGKPDASSWLDMGTQTLVGVLPAVLRPDARRALVIGLGSGTSAGWLAASRGMARVDVAELEPAIVRAARLFERFHPRTLGNPRVRIAIADGRTVVGAGPPSRRWDVIASEPSNPWLGAAASLYTREFYAAARARLGRRGVFAQWLQAYRIDAGTLALVIRTFTRAFEHVALVYSGTQDLVLVGSQARLELAPEQIGPRLQALGAFPTLRERLGLGQPEDLAGCVLAAGEGMRALGAAAHGREHTDDNAALEVGAGAEAAGASADHVLSIVQSRRRTTSLLDALSVESARAGDLFAMQARCLLRDSPDASRFVAAVAEGLGAPVRAPPAPTAPTDYAGAVVALDAMQREYLADPEEAARVARTLTAVAAGDGPEADAAADRLERGFPGGVLFLTRAQVLLELALRRRDADACARAARTLVGAAVLDVPVLDQAARCLGDADPDPELAERLADLRRVARALTPRGIAFE